MRKTVWMSVLVVLMAGLSVPAWAAERGTPEYEKMKAYKEAQRQKRDAEKANPSAKPKGFWQKEAERSGFAGTGAMFGNAISGVVPGTRKEQK